MTKILGAKLETAKENLEKFGIKNIIIKKNDGEILEGEVLVTNYKLDKQNSLAILTVSTFNMEL